MSVKAKSFNNHILLSLPASELYLLADDLSLVSLEPCESLCTAGNEIDQLFFIEHGVVSAVVRNGDKSVQLGMVGNDGLVGCAAVISPNAISYWDITVLFRGEAWAVPRLAFQKYLLIAPTLRRRAQEQAQVSVGQIAQTSICNSQHSLSQRVARWLLLARDKAEIDDLPLTCELIASTLGLSQASVRVSLTVLAERGLIRANRLRTHILDPYGLEEAACDCYSSLRRYAEMVEASGSTLHDEAFREGLTQIR